MNYPRGTSIPFSPKSEYTQLLPMQGYIILIVLVVYLDSSSRVISNKNINMRRGDMMHNLTSMEKSLT